MSDIRSKVRKNRNEEVQMQITEIINNLHSEGLEVEFGTIGTKTTYALIYNPDHTVEYVGYTFIKNMKYFNENTGKLRALNQAIARRETLVEE